MKADLIPIGNSRGVRIPKPIIDQVGLGDTVELTVEKNRIVISPQRRPREGWLESFSVAAHEGEEPLLSVPPNKFDNKEWKW
jgi:antitoxin MazE